ncbi:winged helix-turn-helix transcriptional regulator [Naumannella sp. ID2617S]|uniref:Transcriptional regulator n=1 Tax=Enemella dayhoffiae TaxID=2016507 RepID=A0A255H907_9ACTN|nr:metalloregulator ArsR/SmtB family transcription factor [Enemella dayhoffiae]NNG19143.1 winged helix-turn-helix transcriptional regulator [Naumannella sp. ID2617S]OYO24258.1 transcriptional regulator [Enemella dayhoffiae]
MDGFTLLADPTRRRILDRLRSGECDVAGLIELCEQPQPLVSKHLKVLRDSGLVDARAIGRRRIYHLTEKRPDDVLAWLIPWLGQWQQSFDLLEAALDADTTAPQEGIDR